jgi:hypothetical protein
MQCGLLASGYIDAHQDEQADYKITAGDQHGKPVISVGNPADPSVGEGA